MKSSLALLALSAMVLLPIRMYGQPATLPGNAAAAAMTDSAKKNPAPVVLDSSHLRDTSMHAATDSGVQAPAAPPAVFLTPELLFGVWTGKDSLGGDVTFTFSKLPPDQPAIYKVAVEAGKSTITGICSDMENDLHQLMLNTKEIQDIRTMWSVKYDGTWLVVQDIGGHLIGGSKTFRLQKAPGK